MKTLSNRKHFAYVDESCEQIESFCAHLQPALGCPINGPEITFNGQTHVCKRRNTDKMIQKVCLKLEELNLRFLVLHVAPCHPAARLMQRIVIQACQTLEELEIVYSVSFCL